MQCHLGYVTVGLVVRLLVQSQVDFFFILMPGASECINFKWVLAVLFPLQTSYFCIRINIYVCSEDCIQKLTTPYSVMHMLLLCIVSLYIVCSSPFSKVIIFCGIINHFWKWDLSIKKCVSKFIAMWCFVSQIFTRSDRSRQRISIIIRHLFLFCVYFNFVFKAIIALMNYKLKWSATCLLKTELKSCDHWILVFLIESTESITFFLTNFAFCSLKLLQCVQQKYLRNGCNKYGGKKNVHCLYFTKTKSKCSSMFVFTAVYIQNQFLF